MKIIPGCRLRFKNKNESDPFNPRDWTVHQMRTNEFTQRWLKYIEPNLMVFGIELGDCWCWLDKKGRPIISEWTPQRQIAWNWEDDVPVIKTWNMRQLSARIFFEFPDHWSVYRDKDMCINPNCVRPLHLIPAPHNHPEAKF